MAINRGNGGVTGKRNKPSHGGDTITNFLSSENYEVPQEVSEVDVTVIAGGGGGGNTSGEQGGGGGAGGFRTATNQPVIGGSSIPVSVGAGGAAAADGGNSIFGNTLNPITSEGGGKGGSGGNPAPGPAAGTGGSGGGGGWNQTGAAGNTPPTSPAQGTAGGNGQITNVANMRGGAGGGGASVTATVGVGDPSPKGPTNAAGVGGRGAIATIRGVNEYLAGGGGGGSLNSTSSWATQVGAGGEGGGGKGAVDSTAGVAGTANMGAGGGGRSGPTAGTAGGSGIVIIKQKDKANGVYNMNSQYDYKKINQWPDRNPYLVGNSIRYNVGDSPHMDFTPSATSHPGKFTISTWIKKCDNTSGNDQVIIGATTDSDTTAALDFRGSGDNFKLQFYNAIGGTANNGFNIETNRRFRDPSAWYHVVAAVDTSKSSYTTGVRIYINGKQETSFGATTYNQNVTTPFCTNGSKVTLGARPTDDAQELNGYIAETHFIDGLALGCEYFGENDPDNKDIWRPKKYMFDNYGTNGFQLKFENSAVGSAGASMQGTDTSGNGNHFSTTNLAVTDHTSDSPTNNFATFNDLYGSNTQTNGYRTTLTEGNCQAASQADGKSSGVSSMGVASGKWYAEFKQTASSHANNYAIVGVHSDLTPMLHNNPNGNGVLGYSPHGYGYWGYNATTSNGNKMNDDSSSNYGESYDTDDIIGLAIDLDNGAMYVSKNGTFQASSDPTSGASKTNAIFALPAASTKPDGFYFMVVGDTSSSQTATWQANFGNPPFAISSSNSDANGHGDFEYAVPSGYFALCSKNLAEFG